MAMTYSGSLPGMKRYDGGLGVNTIDYNNSPTDSVSYNIVLAEPDQDGYAEELLNGAYDTLVKY